MAFQDPESARAGYYIRNTRIFLTEAEAKDFAEQRLLEGCLVSAGTINPSYPRRSVGPDQLEAWLKAD